jgi:hypothetical protein
MSGMMDNVKTVNSVLRTLIALVVIGAAGVAGWLGISTYYAADWARQEKEQQLTAAQAQLGKLEKQLAAEQDTVRQKNALLAEKDNTIRDLHAEIVEKDEEIARLDTAMRLLKVDHRLADVSVLDTGLEQNGDPFCLVAFQEINDEGQPIDKAKQFRLRGDEIRIDSWVVKFDDKYVEQQDLHRSSSILAFKRIWGNIEGPLGGHSIESSGTRPTAYARGQPLSDFERKIWDDFWTFAGDEQKADELGITNIGGVCNFQKAIKGKTYRITLRASGGAPTFDAIK